jgi:hypothetical protein
LEVGGSAKTEIAQMNSKLKHWRAVQSINGLEASPVLVFDRFMLGKHLQKS